jgi:uncharacterized RmlC-like cupin family protein
MLNNVVNRRIGPAAPDRAVAVHVIKPLDLDDQTPQTAGMHRLAAVSHVLVESKALWAGVMLAEPGTASSVHHHGPQETVVYVLSGPSRVRWGGRLEHEVDLEPGDFVFIPPFMPHQEINPSPDQPTQWVVVRSGGEAVVVTLTKAPDGGYVAADLADGHSDSKQENTHVRAG